MKHLYSTARAVIMLMCLGFCLNAQAVDTEDHLSLSINKELVPDGSTYAIVTVSLVGSRIYTAYNMDVHLPEGVTVYYNNNSPVVSGRNNIWAYDEDFFTGEKTYLHSFGYTYGVVGERQLRVECASNTNQNFTATSGVLFMFAIVASPYCKPGSLDITIDGINFTALEGGSAVKYVPADETHAITVGNSSTVSVNVNAANKYSTLVLPFAAALPDGLQAYSCGSVEADNLVLEAASSLAAYKPYILYAEGGYSGTLTGTVDASGYAEVVSDGLMRGAIVKQQVTEGFVLQNQGDGVKFYNIDGQNFSIPVGRCWLAVSGSLSRSFGWGDTPTAVSSAVAERAADIYYNIDGTRAYNPQPGLIYIYNGKKVLKLK